MGEGEKYNRNGANKKISSDIIKLTRRFFFDFFATVSEKAQKVDF